MLRRLLATSNTLSYTFLRLAVGAVMLPHGYEKVTNFQKTLDTFTKPDGMNVPTWLAILVIVAESLGALGLIVGFLTRICAVGMICVMAGAIFLVHWKDGFTWHPGWQPHLLVIGGSLALLIGGAGAFSIDARLAKKK